MGTQLSVSILILALVWPWDLALADEKPVSASRFTIMEMQQYKIREHQQYNLWFPRVPVISAVEVKPGFSASFSPSDPMWQYSVSGFLGSKVGVAYLSRGMMGVGGTAFTLGNIASVNPAAATMVVEKGLVSTMGNWVGAGTRSTITKGVVRNLSKGPVRGLGVTILVIGAAVEFFSDIKSDSAISQLSSPCEKYPAVVYYENPAPPRTIQNLTSVCAAFSLD